MTVKPSMNRKQLASQPQASSSANKKASSRKGMKRSPIMKTFVRLFQVALVAFAIVVAWIIFIQWKVQLGTNQTLPKQVDVGIVLGASLRNDLPSPGLQERLDLALELYKQGRFKQLIVSGGLDHNGSKLTEAEGMRNYLVSHGVPQGSIFLEPHATSTYENLLYSKYIMEEKGLVSSIIMTHRFHSSRSLDIAETIGFKQPYVSSTKSDVLFMPYHDVRETLAYTKWYGTKLLLKLGL
ncbi:YdcF family protein [Paenibacillus roseipurpureus]|uniref:YdcF family protein n=1 Tax=Paenibacillus roseopurpureus TaxID=2918901 RepID=A0AA96RKP7_9BACL|nr:YdcF family protein [Paenibacillus sp. MBLB1832]WNR42292.1 YdcF family protein [Paenibacillus sp. MBLB1832]